MEVGAAGGDEVEFIGEAKQGVHLLLVVARVVGFDAAEAGGGEAGDEIAQRGRREVAQRGMRQRRDATGVRHEAKRVLGREAEPVGVGRRALGEVAPEGVLFAARVAALDERLREVRARHDALVAGGVHDVLPGDAAAEADELADDLDVAAVAAFADARERRAEGGVAGVAAVGEEVDDHAGDVDAEFDAGDRPHAARPCGGEEVRNALGGVVVGQGHRRKPRGGAQLHQLLRGAGAVGKRGVDVQVDHAGQGRL